MQTETHQPQQRSPSSYHPSRTSSARSYDSFPPHFQGTLTAKESRTVNLFWAYTRYVAWQVMAKIVLGIVYLALVSEGSRRLIPSLGQKLYKLVPLLDRLDHRIDLAHCFALFVLVGCWSCWSWILQFWLGIKPYGRESAIVIPLAFIFIGVDAVLFYMSTATFRWGGSTMSFYPLLATIAYIAILIFVTFTGINLKQELRKAQS